MRFIDGMTRTGTIDYVGVSAIRPPALSGAGA
jgi:hypothetical protein